MDMGFWTDGEESRNMREKYSRGNDMRMAQEYCLAGVFFLDFIQDNKTVT
jgi:hypothetical protein